MQQDDFPDVLGWELPGAIEAMRALGIPVSVTHTRPPLKRRRTQEPATPRHIDDVVHRVVATRPRYGGGCVLIVCAEAW